MGILDTLFKGGRDYSGNEKKEIIADEKVTEAGGCVEKKEESVNTSNATINNVDESRKEKQSLEKPIIKPDSSRQILELLNGLNGKVSSLNDLFSEKISNTEADERTITFLHAELQQYKNDLYSQIIKPILIDIIDIREGILHTLNFLEKDTDKADPGKDAFEEYAEQTEYVLEKYGVYPYKSEAGSVFNPLKQRVVKKIETNDQSLHGKVSESLNFGYEYKEKTISFEKVNVYFYVKTNQKG